MVLAINRLSLLAFNTHLVVIIPIDLQEVYSNTLKSNSMPTQSFSRSTPSAEPWLAHLIMVWYSITGTCPLLRSRDENGSDTNGYHLYHICFHISGRIRIRIRIMSTMSDKIELDIDIINMWFKYSDTDTVSDVKYSDSNTDRSKSLKTNSVSNTVGKYPYRFHPY